MRLGAGPGPASGGGWGALGVLGLVLLAGPAGAWYKHVASPRYHTVGRASGLLMGVRRSPYLWRRDSADGAARASGSGPRAERREPLALALPGPGPASPPRPAAPRRLPQPRAAGLPPPPARPEPRPRERTARRPRTEEASRGLRLSEFRI